MELDCKQALAKILVADVLSSQVEADFRVFRDHLKGHSLIPRFVDFKVHLLCHLYEPDGIDLSGYFTESSSAIIRVEVGDISPFRLQNRCRSPGSC